MASDWKLKVLKIWDESVKAERKEEVEVFLKINGTVLSSIMLNPENAWHGTFTELDELMSGRKIVYSVEEMPIESYTSSITGNMSQGFILTNTFEEVFPSESTDSSKSTEPLKLTETKKSAESTKTVSQMPKTGENEKTTFEEGILLLLLGLILILVRRRLGLSPNHEKKMF